MIDRSCPDLFAREGISEAVRDHQTRLIGEQVSALVAAYRRGVKIDDLARQFSLHPSRVYGYVHRSPST
jgi:hypothetical protein